MVLVSEAYLSIILKSHKRRVCALCYTDARRRLSLCCGAREELLLVVLMPTAGLLLSRACCSL